MKKLGLGLMCLSLLSLGGFTTSVNAEKSLKENTVLMDKKVEKSENKKKEKTTESISESTESSTEEEVSLDKSISKVSKEQLKELDSFVKDNLKEDKLSFDGKDFNLLNVSELTETQSMLTSEYDFDMPVVFSAEPLKKDSKTSTNVLVHKKSDLSMIKYAHIGEKVEVTVEGKSKKLEVFDRVQVENSDMDKLSEKLYKGLDFSGITFVVETNSGFTVVYAK